MLVALVLSFTLTLPSSLRYDIVGLIGLTGASLSGLAKKFRRPG